jgi:hypothetical protein
MLHIFLNQRKGQFWKTFHNSELWRVLRSIAHRLVIASKRAEIVPLQGATNSVRRRPNLWNAKDSCRWFPPNIGIFFCFLFKLVLDVHHLT